MKEFADSQSAGCTLGEDDREEADKRDLEGVESRGSEGSEVCLNRVCNNGWGRIAAVGCRLEGDLTRLGSYT